MSAPKASILISSFDGYSCCWGPVCHGFTKYWPDCPFPIYLMTNLKDHPHPTIEVLKVGPDRGWSVRMLTALERIQTPYVIYFQEDYWIAAPVDTARIQQYLALMERKGLNYIRLVSNPPPDFDYPDDSRLGVLANSAIYRTSVQITLWRREVLIDLIRPEENVWQFELNGTIRSRKYGPTFLCTKRGTNDFHHGIYYVCTAVNAGRWFRYAKTYARNEGIEIDFSALPMETWWDDFKRRGTLGRSAKLTAYRMQLALREPQVALEKIRRRLRGFAKW